MNDDLKTILANVCCNTGEERFCNICIMNKKCNDTTQDLDVLYESVKRVIEQNK